MNAKVRSYQDIVNALERARKTLPRLQVFEMGRVETPGGIYPFFHLSMEAAEDAAGAGPPVFISGGIHGDEPGGVWAVLELLRRLGGRSELLRRFRFTILPCINPFGYEHNTRHNGTGIDLNRRFREQNPPAEVRMVKEAVGDRPFRLTMEFHEDVDTDGFYLYELTRLGEPAWGHSMTERIAEKYPVNRRQEIEDMAADGGVIRRSEEDRDFQAMVDGRTDWPQALYHYHNGTPHSFTTETPIHLSRNERAEIHLLALETALEKLWEFHIRPNL